MYSHGLAAADVYKRPRYMSKLKKNSLALVFVICLLCVFLCGAALAEETDNGVGYTATPVYVDGLLSWLSLIHI